MKLTGEGNIKMLHAISGRIPRTDTKTGHQEILRSAEMVQNWSKFRNNHEQSPNQAVTYISIIVLRLYTVENQLNDNQ